ncbi:hypothetical protein KDA06_03165 [Candidatus Saccharibacteria bacterium]|nr:hypothetical protein [Candidatus Saccharibacteria bacterium]
MKNLFKWFVHDKKGNVVMWQWPNFQLWLWLGLSVMARLTSDTLHSVFSYLSFVALLVWALFEVFWGDSPFRRVLGAVIALLAIWHKFW